MPLVFVHPQTKKHPDIELENARKEIERVTSAYRTGKELYAKLQAEYMEVSRGGKARGAADRELEEARRQLARAEQTGESERKRADKHAARADALDKELLAAKEAKRATERLNTQLASRRGGERELADAHEARRAAERELAAIKAKPRDTHLETMLADAHEARRAAERELAAVKAKPRDERLETMLAHIDTLLGVCHDACPEEVKEHLHEARKHVRAFARSVN